MDNRIVYEIASLIEEDGGNDNVISHQTPDGDWFILYDPPLIPVRQYDYVYWHSDYDGLEDDRCGHASSVEEAKRDIDSNGIDILRSFLLA